MSFQVFEHLDNLYIVLEYLYTILNEGAVGVINVPNGQQICTDALYHQITVEHINYFSPYSLAAMAKSAGFQILEIDNAVSTVELNIYVRKPCLYEYSGNTFLQVLQKQRSDLKDQMLHIKSKSNAPKITVWGAGAKSRRYFALLDKEIQLSHLVDSSADKVGMYVHGIDIPIELANKQIIDESDCILIFASSYNQEIMKTLHEEYNFKGKLIYFENNQLCTNE